jgi:hypothetical protein
VVSFGGASERGMPFIFDFERIGSDDDRLRVEFYLEVLPRMETISSFSRINLM